MKGIISVTFKFLSSFKFSVLIPNTVYLNKCNPHKQKFFEVPNNF